MLSFTCINRLGENVNYLGQKYCLEVGFGSRKIDILGLVWDKGWEKKNSLEVGLGSGFVRESLVEGKRILIEKRTIFGSIFVLDCLL